MCFNLITFLLMEGFHSSFLSNLSLSTPKNSRADFSKMFILTSGALGKVFSISFPGEVVTNSPKGNGSEEKTLQKEITSTNQLTVCAQHDTVRTPKFHVVLQHLKCVNKVMKNKIFQPFGHESMNPTKTFRSTLLGSHRS
jgi:hypothetical protein